MPIINRNTPVANIQVPVPTPTQPKTPPTVRASPRPSINPISFGGEQDEMGNTQGVSAVILPWSPQNKTKLSRSKPKRYSEGPTEEDFQRMLDENPDDHHTRMVFADWLQERNDPRAEGYRALGQLRKRTYRGRYDIDNPLSMWTHERNTNTDFPDKFRLPMDWFNLVQNTSHEYDRNVAHNHWVYHNNRREGDDQAALAFGQLPEDRKQQILNPTKLSRKYSKVTLNPTQKLRAKKVELVVLPKSIEGKKCGSCRYAKRHGENGIYCTNNQVHMNVKSNWSCKLWDAKGVKKLSRKKHTYYSSQERLTRG